MNTAFGGLRYNLPTVRTFGKVEAGLRDETQHSVTYSLGFRQASTQLRANIVYFEQSIYKPEVYEATRLRPMPVKLSRHTGRNDE